MAVVDPAAAQVFAAQLSQAANQRCFDSGAEGPTWASIPHGIYLSIGASGVHRSLGVQVSYIQSTTMDSWKPLHLRMMELGGNERFRAFLEAQGVPEEMPIREKYQTRAAAWYRENLRAEAEGIAPPAPLEPGTGPILTCGPATAEQLLLDRIFAQAPAPGAMTVGGVPSRPRSSGGAARSGGRRESAEGGDRARRCALSSLMKGSRDSVAAASAALADAALRPAQRLSDQLSTILGSSSSSSVSAPSTSSSASTSTAAAAAALAAQHRRRMDSKAIRRLDDLDDDDDEADAATPRSRSRSRETSPAPRCAVAAGRISAVSYENAALLAVR